MLTAIEIQYKNIEYYEQVIEMLEDVTGLMEDVMIKKRGLFSRVLKEDEVKIKKANAQELLKRVR